MVHQLLILCNFKLIVALGEEDNMAASNCNSFLIRGEHELQNGTCYYSYLLLLLWAKQTYAIFV